MAYINATRDQEINRTLPTTIFYPSGMFLFFFFTSNEQGFVITPFGSDMSKVSIIFQLYNSNSEFLRNKWRETAKQRSLFVHRVCLLCC